MPNVVRAGWAGLMVLNIGCQADYGELRSRSADVGGTLLTDEQVLAAGLVPDDWPSGIGMGTWWHIGSVEWVAGEEIESNFAATIAEAQQALPSTSPSDGLQRFVMLDVPAGQVYRVAVDPLALALLGQGALAEVVEDDASPVEAAGGMATSSFGSAVREHLGEGLYKEHPYVAIGHSSCTGALISQTGLLTAAHCLITFGEGNYQRWYETAASWTVGRNGAWDGEDPNRCFLQTFVDKMFVPEPVVEPGQVDYHYYGHDYGLVMLKNVPQEMSPPTGGCPNTPGRMNRGWFGIDTQEQRFRHSGFPGCNQQGAPPGCVENGHYETYWVSTRSHPENVVFEDGLPTVVESDAIGSPGHSGGPMWYLREHNDEPVVVGTLVGGPAGESYNRVIRRLTPTSLNNLFYWSCLAGPCLTL